MQCINRPKSSCILFHSHLAFSHKEEGIKLRSTNESLDLMVVTEGLAIIILKAW